MKLSFSLPACSAMALFLACVVSTAPASPQLNIQPPATPNDLAMAKAAKEGNVAEVRRLLALGTNPNGHGILPTRPLHAASKQSTEMMVLLIEAGADVNARVGENERQPLHEAAAYNPDPRAIEVLLKAGADIEARTTEGLTPLHESARNPSWEVATLLVRAGADVNAASKQGYRPLDLCAREPSMLRLLIDSGAKVDARDLWGRSALHGAALTGNCESVTLLLEAGASANQVSSNAQTPTPLIGAIMYKRYDVVRLLLERGADVNLSSENGDTPLHEAVKESPSIIIELLLKAGANVNAPNKQGITPLHTALLPHMVVVPATSLTPTRVKQAFNLAVLPTLLKAGAGVNAQDRKGFTPLHHASASLDATVIDALVKLGADVKVATTEGRDTPLHLAARNNPNLDATATLVVAGADVNAKRKGGKTPLFYAVGNSNTRITEFLLDQGADVNATADDGSTPLHAAAGEGTKAVNAMLIAAGADPRVKDLEGRTPFARAAAHNRDLLWEAMMSDKGTTSSKSQ
jgi:ankyrin repeat protein